MIYVYRRDDGTEFELRESIKADPLTTCPTTGQGVVRVIQAFSFQLSGEVGRNDYFVSDHTDPAAMNRFSDSELKEARAKKLHEVKNLKLKDKGRRKRRASSKRWSWEV